MGLFSRKKIISVSSVTINLAGKDTQTNYLRKTINSSITSGSDVAGTLSSAYLHGMGIKIEQAYKYGRDHYSLGLPEGKIYYGTPDIPELTSVIQGLNQGKDIVFVQADYGAPDISYWVDQYVTQKYEYDADYGGMGKPPAGIANDADIGFTVDSTGKVTIYYGTAPNQFKETVTFPGIDFQGGYYMAIYRIATKGSPTSTVETRPTLPTDVEETNTTTENINNYGQFSTKKTTVAVVIDAVKNITTITTTIQIDVVSRKQYFFYKAGVGTYPTLDSIVNRVTRASIYYPVVPLRLNNKDLTDPSQQGTDLYKTSKKLLNKLNLKYTMLGDKLNENPDVGEIDHAFFVMGISFNSQYQTSIDYLHEFFKYLSKTSPSNKAEYLTWYAQTSGATGHIGANATRPPVNKLSLRQGPYDVTVAYQYVDFKVVDGVIGKKGTVLREKGIAASITIINDLNASVELKTNVSVVYFKKQISDTQYEVIELCGAEHSNNVYKGHSVNTNGYDCLSDPDEQGFVVPLCQNILDEMNLVNRTQMTFDCMFMVINSYSETKAKWYQSGIFQILTVAIAIVVSVVSFGGAIAGIQGVIAAATAAGTSVGLAVATFIGTQVLIGLAVTYGIQLLGQVLGADFLFIAAIAMLAYGAVSAYTSYGSSSNPGLPYADEVLGLVSSVSKGATSQLQRDLEVVMKEMKQNQENYQQQMKDIEDAMDMFQMNKDVDLYALTQSAYFNLFEQPNEFLVRTLNSNPGIVTLDAVSRYVGNALTLPQDLNSLRS